MGVRECQERIDSREFSEWIAYDAIDPIGPDRPERNSAQVCAVIANSVRGKGDKAWHMKDFLPRYGPPQRRTVAELAAILNRHFVRG